MKSKKHLLLFAFMICLKALGQTAATPVFSPSGGTFSGSVAVTVTDSTSGALIFCTTDGTTPDISSPQVTAPISITSTQTLQCMAAVPGINQSNAQNNDPPPASGTFWKHPNCKCSGTACSVTTGAGCVADDPGGSGIPTNSTHINGVSSPSLSGASMEFGETAQVGSQTNILFPVSGSFGACDGCVSFLETHDYYWPSPMNASANEDDMYQFNLNQNIRYMLGGQYCFGSGCPGGASGWDMAGNSNVPWTAMGVSAGGTTNVWHHFQRLFHRVPAEFTSRPCSASGAWPYIYVDFLGIDNVKFTNGGAGWKFCANALPATWSSGAGQQAQIDIGSHATATTYNYYWDNINFLATFPSSSVNTATYTIGASTTTFGGITGSATVSGNAVIQ